MIASRAVRVLLISALFLAACGAPPRRSTAPRVVLIRPIETEPPAVELPPVDEQVAAARAELVEHELVAEHRDRLDGEARLHLVFERGRCYRVWVGADRAVEARLEDEHGHAVAAGAGSIEGVGWLEEVCPRWSGSFALVVTSSNDARALAVLLAARPAERLE